MRGVAVCEQLSQGFGLHLNRTHLSPNSVVRRHYTGTTVRSARYRSKQAVETIRAHGESIAVFELQSDLYFGSAELLTRAVDQDLQTLRFIVFDANRVGQVDAGAKRLLGEFTEKALANGVQSVTAGLKEGHRQAGSLAGLLQSLPSFPDVDRALEWCEDKLLESMEVPNDTSTRDLRSQELLAGLDDEGLTLIEERTETREFPAGAIVVKEGEPATELFFVISGQVSVNLALSGSTRRLACFGPGAAFGEMAILDDRTRSSTVIADQPTVCRSLSRSSLEDLGRHHPELIAALYRQLARSLSTRLRDSNEMVRSLQ